MKSSKYFNIRETLEETPYALLYNGVTPEAFDTLRKKYPLSLDIEENAEKNKFYIAVTEDLIATDKFQSQYGFVTAEEWLHKVKKSLEKKGYECMITVTPNGGLRLYRGRVLSHVSRKTI